MFRRATRTLSVRFAWRAAATTVLVVGAVGGASVAFWQSELQDALEDGVADHLRALEVELDLAGIDPGAGAPPVVLPTPERFVQVVTPGGRVVATSSELASLGPLLPTADVLAAAPDDYVTDIGDPRGNGDRTLVMARLMNVDGVDLIGIVGASHEPATAARSTALWILFVGVPLLGIAIGYGVWLAVTYALRPVSSLATRADAVARGSAPWRLDVEPDTVEMSALAHSLDALLEHLRQSFESERRFLDDASHELRTPIAVARGELDLLRQEVADAPGAAAAVASSIEELDRLDRLAADLLMLARARSSQVPAAMCDLAGILRRATGTVMRESDQRRVNVRVRGTASTIGDENSLERAFRNIVANAVASCHDDVEVSLSETDGEASIVIADDGPGFPAEMTGSSFPRFATGRGRRNGGTGLGLAIASAIVAAHGGELLAENRESGGARVTVRLPSAS
jgi:signal transduction histidine kinase